MFDLTFLLHPNEKAFFDKKLKCSMGSTYPSSLESHPAASHSYETEGGNDHILGTSMGTNRSTSIPLPSSHVPRTQSELQLSIDEEAAEQRDARMFYRLVNGIRERHQQQYAATMSSVHWENSFEDSISRLVRARLTPLDHSEQPDEQDEAHPHEVSAARNELPPVVDSWSITGFDPEENSPSTHLQTQPEESNHDHDYHEDEGFFDLDL